MRIIQRDRSTARARFQQSLDLRRRLAASDPSSASLQRDVSVSLNKLGDVLVSPGDLSGARARFQESLDLIKRLATSDLSSASLQRDASFSLKKLGDVLIEQGDLSSARARFQESLDLRKRLAASDLSSATLQRDVWVSMWKLVKFPDIGISRSQIAAAMQDMQRRGVLAPTDVRFLEEARRNAEPQKSR